MFPIYDDRAKFKKKTGYLEPFPQKLRDTIEAIQPDNVPKIAPELMIANFNRTLAFIDDWSRKDRHRRLHVVGSFIPSVTPMFRIPSPAKLVSLKVRKHVFLENETQIARWQIEGYAMGMNVQANPNLAIDIALQNAPHQSLKTIAWGIDSL